MQFVPDSVLTSVSGDVRLKDVELLNIKIRAEGEINKSAHIAFSKLDIFLGNKSINDFPVRELQPISIKNDTGYISLNIERKEGLDNIVDFNNKKIIGLGEAVHGNDNINNLTCNLITYAVEEQNCKLVLLEGHGLDILHYNRFIQDTDYVFNDSIDQYLYDLLFSLRTINTSRSQNERVKFLGIDLNDYSTLKSFINYLSQLNPNESMDELNLRINYLQEKNHEQALLYLQDNETLFKKLLFDEEYKYILHFLANYSDIDDTYSDTCSKRDSMMFVNTKFLIDNFTQANDQVLIYAHTGHINPVSTYPAVPTLPFGYYMKQEYNDTYATFLITTDIGSIFVLGGNSDEMTYIDFHTKRKHLKLAPPPKSSIEYYLSSLNHKQLFYPLTDEFDHLILSRATGSHYDTRQFYPYNLYQRHNGIFFVGGEDNYSDEYKSID